MCGIAGIVSFHGPAAAEHIKKMTDILKHRGPDDEGFYAAGTGTGRTWHLSGSSSKVQYPPIERFNERANLFFGHRRLSILDPTPAGHQPMADQENRAVIVFNGEIYNYIEIRKELETAGCRFVTSTDTEVILHAYLTWGEQCVERFNGMWAFVIFDAKKNILFGARDRHGVKPFYYYHDASHFAFASEMKALVSLPFVRTAVNEKAVFDYLVFGWQEHDEEGFFSNIRELRPSFTFVCDLSTGAMKQREYYTLSYTDEFGTYDEGTMRKHAEEVRRYVEQAVRLRLRSDVPIGSCLSGGIDSSSIVCIINAMLGKESIIQVGERQKVFTASYKDRAVDESQWAELVAGTTRSAWFRTYPDEEQLFNELNDLVYHQDVPFTSTSIYAQYSVMRLAAENGVKVVLDGQGGDELFTGYTVFYRTFFAEMLNRFRLCHLLKETRSLGNAPVRPGQLAKDTIRLYASRCVPRQLFGHIFRFTRHELSFLDRDFLHRNESRVLQAQEKSFFSLNRMLHEYMTGLNLKTLLRYEDRNSMRFSIESRTPFADDKELIEYLFKVPSCYKIHNGWSKVLLREAMTGILPEAVRTRRDKIGFATPEQKWFRKLQARLAPLLDADLDAYVDTQSLLQNWGTLVNDSARTGMLWRIINLAVWKKVYGL